MLAMPQARPGSRDLGRIPATINLLNHPTPNWGDVISRIENICRSHSRVWLICVFVSVTNISESHVGAGLNTNPLTMQWGLQLMENHQHLWRPLLLALSHSWKLKGSSEKATKMVQFSSVDQLCPTLYDPLDGSMPGLPVHHQLPEFIQTHIHWVGDAIQPSHPLSSPSPAFDLSQHQDLFKWVSSSHQVAKVLEFQFQHQSFQRIFRTDFLKDVYGNPNSGWITCMLSFPSVHPYIYPLVHLSMHPFIYPSTHPTNHLSTHSSIHPYNR